MSLLETLVQAFSLFPLKDYRLINIAYQQAVGPRALMTSACARGACSLPQWDGSESQLFSFQSGECSEHRPM